MLQHTDFKYGKNNGSWRCYCSVTNLKKDGKSLRISKTGSTKKEARERLNQALLSLEKGFIIKKESSNFLADMNSFIKRAQKIRDVSDSTFNYWERIIRNQIAPYSIANQKTNSIVHSDIVNYILELEEHGISKSLQKKAYNMLTMFFSDYYQEQPYINPVYGMKFKTGTQKVEIAQIMNDIEIRNYISSCQSALDCDKNVDLMEFILVMYLRKGEALALTFRDFYIVEESINIHKTTTRNKDGKRIIASTTKTKNSTRVLKCNNRAYDILANRLEKAKREKDFSYDWYIWRSDEDPFKPLSDHAVRMLNERTLKRANISKKIRVHDLRHSGISFYLRHGCSLADVSKRAGHSKQSITADIYSHVLDESLKLQSKKESEITLNLI